VASAQQHIELLDNCLATYCKPLYSLMQPPLERPVVEDYFKKWQIKDDDLMEFFLWKNGIENDAAIPTEAYDYTGFGVIPTLQHIDELMQETQYWKPSLFPLVSSFGGDFFLYETDNLSKDFAKLFLQCPTFGNIGEYVVSYFDNIKQMILTINEGFEKGGLFYDADKMCLNKDLDLYFEIAKMNNPNSEYWLDV
jgi:hypothetical protein